MQEAGPMVFLGGKTGAVQGGTKKRVERTGLTFENVAQEVLSDKEKEVSASEDSTFSRRKEVPKDSAKTDEDDPATDGSEVKHGNISIPVYNVVFDNSQPLKEGTEEASTEEENVSYSVSEAVTGVQQAGVVTSEENTSTKKIENKEKSGEKEGEKTAKIQDSLTISHTAQDKSEPKKSSENTATKAEVLSSVSNVEEGAILQNVGGKLSADEGKLRPKNKVKTSKKTPDKTDTPPPYNANTTSTATSAEINKEIQSPVIAKKTKKAEVNLKVKDKTDVPQNQQETAASLTDEFARKAPQNDTTHENKTSKINTSKTNLQEASKYISAIKNIKKPLQKTDKTDRTFNVNETKVRKTKLSSVKQSHNFAVNRDISLQKSTVETALKVPDENFSKVLENKVVQQTSNKVISMVKTGEMQADFQLEPPALGKLNLRIVTKGENIYTFINAESDTAKQILNKSQHILRDSLESSGFQLEKFSVNVGGESGHRFNEQPETRKNSKNRKYSTVSATSIDSFVPRYNIASSGRLDISA